MSEHIPQTPESIPAIILAAGRGSRMGQAKQLLRTEGKTLLEIAVQKAGEVTGCQPIVVTGAHQELVREHLAAMNVLEAHNPLWSTGMGSSISTGVSALLAHYPKALGCLIILVDQPLVSADKLRLFLAAFLAEKTSMVVARYKDTLGVPAVFHRNLFPELYHLAGQSGAKKIIFQYQPAATIVPCAEAADDIDTPDDWKRFIDNQHKK